VELGPGNETVVNFTDVSLPSEGGVFEHGVRTANDSQTAEITVGSPDIELVKLTQPDALTLEEEFTTELTLVNNGTAPYDGGLVHVTNLNDTIADSGVIALNRTTALTLAPGESNTLTSSVLTFAEINDRFDAASGGFAPGDNVETGYQRGQHLNAPADTVVEDLYGEEISIIPADLPNVTIANLSIAGQGDDATVTADSYDVTAEMSHTGGAGSDVPIALTVGEKTLSKNVSLEANKTVMVTFENVTSVEPGSYNVTLSGTTNSVNGTLTLSTDNSNDQTTDEGEDNADGAGPGFGPATVLAGVCTAGYLLRRRASNDETEAS
jgi:hypothetical protein